jgi:hypothetical protein
MHNPPPMLHFHSRGRRAQQLSFQTSILLDRCGRDGGWPQRAIGIVDKIAQHWLSINAMVDCIICKQWANWRWCTSVFACAAVL